MPDYDFSTLNDKEFEVLCTELLSKVHGQRFERFKPGKDGGVDGRYFKGSGSEVILQCKHWQATPLERLVAHLKNVEREKVVKLRPSRYLLAVSHPLSRADKSRIREVLDPFAQRDDDILGREDLNDILATDPAIERRHYKLWIRSSAVLGYFLNKAILDRSAFSLEEMLRDAKLYVPTALHDAAIEKLDQLGSVIITGAPGIGKSTLASHMVLHYVERGFALVQIADELREAEGAYGVGEKQVFFFDDFLGRNYLEALSGHEGAHIMQFIRRVSHDKSKRFVLTSRTTILNQGKALIDMFAQNNIGQNELEIRIESLNEIDKARILYNHMWHSTLDAEYIEQLYVAKRYRTVISHLNFNPRLIRFITDISAISESSVDDYWSYTRGLLENPARVWEHPFEAQLDDFGRVAVLLVTLNRRAIRESDLAEAYARLVARPEYSGLSGRRDFLLTVRHLAGSLLTRSVEPKSVPTSATLDLFNPSIGDYVLRRYSTDIPSLRAGLLSLRSSTSIDAIAGLMADGHLHHEQGFGLVVDVLQAARSCSFLGYSTEHIAAAGFLLLKSSSLRESQIALLSAATAFLLSTDPPHYFAKAATLIEWAIKRSGWDESQVEAWAEAACARSPYPDEIQTIARILEELGGGVLDRVGPQLESATVEYIADNARDEFDASDIFDGATPDNLAAARRSLADLARQKLEEFGASPTIENIQFVVDAYDIDREAEVYFADDDSEGHWHHHDRSEQADEIDDLFDRN